MFPAKEGVITNISSPMGLPEPSVSIGIYSTPLEVHLGHCCLRMLTIYKHTAQIRATRAARCNRLVDSPLKSAEGTSAALAGSFPLSLPFLTLKWSQFGPCKVDISHSCAQDISQFHYRLTNMVFWPQTSAGLQTKLCFKKSSTFSECTQKEASLPELLDLRQSSYFCEEETLLQWFPSSSMARS